MVVCLSRRTTFVLSVSIRSSWRRIMTCGSELAEYGRDECLWNISAMAKTILTHNYISQSYSRCPLPNPNRAQFHAAPPEAQCRKICLRPAEPRNLRAQPTQATTSIAKQATLLARSEVLLFPAPHSILRLEAKYVRA